MFAPNRNSWIAVAILLGLLTLPSVASAQGSDKMQWSITPYIWGVTTKVDLKLRDTDIGEGEISFDELLDVLDSVFLIHVEGGKGNWSAFGDLIYLDVSESTKRTLLTVDVENQQTFIDAAAAYWPGGVGSPLNLFGGVRYSGFDTRFSFSQNDGTPVSERKTGEDYYDALFGLRYRFDLSERWNLLTHGDFSFGDSEGTYLLRANFGYVVGKRRQNRILFGYQYKQAEFRKDDLKTEFTYYGPMAAFNFRF